MKKATFFRDTSSEKTIKKSDKDLTAMISAAKIRQTDRTVSGDPLAITLHPDFLDTLSAGDHTIEIVTTNGSASAKFSAVRKGNGG